MIRAVAYIDANWNARPQWMPGAVQGGYWGDARVQANDLILERWLEEISDPFWLHGREDLFEQLGWEPTGS